MAKTKYFSATNSTKRHSGIAFLPYGELGGSVPGQYSTSDPDEIKRLEVLAKDPRNGITEINESQFEANEKKKAPAPVSLESKALSNQSSLRQQTAVKPGGVVVPEPVPSTRIPNKVLPSSHDAITLDKVSPPPAPRESEQAKRKKG